MNLSFYPSSLSQYQFFKKPKVLRLMSVSTPYFAVQEPTKQQNSKEIAETIKYLSYVSTNRYNQPNRNIAAHNKPPP